MHIKIFMLAYFNFDCFIYFNAEDKNVIFKTQTENRRVIEKI